jgi:lipoprotein-anchoring transpeptidase ErfK/SrfK
VPKRTIVFSLCVGAIVVATGAALRSGPSAGGSHAGTSLGSLAAEARNLPRPEQPAFDVGAPVLLARGETQATFAPVARVVEARTAPSPAAPAVAELATRTPDDTTNIVNVVRQRMKAHVLWVEIRLPVLPNNQTGWVPRTSLAGYGFVHTRLVVDRERLTATLFADGRRVFRAPVAVGQSYAPTPRGHFVVVDRLTRFSDPIYGPIAFGTSARSPVLTDWPGGGVVGIHGTNEPALIPGRVSHGCIRMRNADILRLSRLMPIGTPLTIR